tara:strand:- start:116 stop:781 length:666 start_codon:yes stop_codon:yes gene_type:complete
MPIYTPGKLTLSRIQQYPIVIGESFGGGYFAGYISHTADGSPTHALIVAPRATGATGTGYTLTTSFAWKTANTATTGTTSTFDGAANTAAMVAAGIADHPAAQFCVNLRIGGYGDWYLPARYELDIAYFNLKPSTSTNDANHGANVYSVPPRPLSNTTLFPSQTPLTAFNTTAEAFAASNHWSSTESTATNAFDTAFNNGRVNNFTKSLELLIRAFRRIAL